MSFQPFIDLASALGGAVSSYFTKQGVQTPNQRAVSTSGDSFDFSAANKKLTQPVTNTAPQSGVQVLDGATDFAGQIFNSLGRNVSSAIDNLFGNANKMPSVDSRNQTNVVRAVDAFSSQYLNLGEAFKYISNLGKANPEAGAEDNQKGVNTLWVIGGFVALGAVVLLSRKGK